MERLELSETETEIALPMEVNGTEARAEEVAVTLALSVAVTVISSIGLLLNAYILFIIVITKQDNIESQNTY
ncbi:hypothetical protein PYW07_004410 [Mythimna separata]|uniref:Uncharacterized protein n=1 Tax=Mythimna separata TaxID=271217 RepID=A0AAD8DY17_MYTSE|nr:hypothetical protein PYW07_004410 [Mythimna separata]